MENVENEKNEKQEEGRLVIPHWPPRGVSWLYHDSSVALACGKCEDIIPKLDLRVDHVITDPPYSEVTHSGARTGDQKTKLVLFDSVKSSELRSIFTIAGARRWTLGTMDWKHVAELEKYPPDTLRFVRFGIWDKGGYTPQFSGDRPAMGWEAIGILHASGGRMRWNGGGKRALYTFNRSTDNEHPTEKPIGLFKQLIMDFTDPDEVILDPWAGSGTTGRAAKDLGRRCIMIEKDPKWCTIAAEKLSQEVLL
jgi:site-specific DNA-methyltransferase (adenine-specific)